MGSSLCKPIQTAPLPSTPTQAVATPSQARAGAAPEMRPAEEQDVWELLPVSADAQTRPSEARGGLARSSFSMVSLVLKEPVPRPGVQNERRVASLAEGRGPAWKFGPWASRRMRGGARAAPRDRSPLCKSPSLRGFQVETPLVFLFSPPPCPPLSVIINFR